MTEEDHKKLLENVHKGKRTTKLPEQDLFGETVQTNIMNRYKKIFQSLIAEHNYIFIREQVIGKKNKYIAYMRYTGRSICCDAPYDKKTKICTSCGRLTKSGKAANSVGLNQTAMNYKKSSLQGFINAREKIHKELESNSFAIIGVFLIRKDNRDFDFDNMFTMINDQLTDSGIIKNDTAKKLMTLPMGYIVNKQNPGLILKVINTDDYFNFLLKQL
ncbi:MAG: hypothetical protein JXR64_02895 [Spirochaetales bacterium]|nr:hypothetical protein [Spirochaetales bacterium]